MYIHSCTAVILLIHRVCDGKLCKKNYQKTRKGALGNAREKHRSCCCRSRRTVCSDGRTECLKYLKNKPLATEQRKVTQHFPYFKEPLKKIMSYGTISFLKKILTSRDTIPQTSFPATLHDHCGVPYIHRRILSKKKKQKNRI